MERIQAAVGGGKEMFTVADMIQILMSGITLVCFITIFILSNHKQKELKEKLKKLKQYEELDKDKHLLMLQFTVGSVFGDYIEIDAGDEEQMKKAKALLLEQACECFEKVAKENMDDFFIVKKSDDENKIKVWWKFMLPRIISHK